MKEDVSGFCLPALPVDIIASYIMPMLNIKDLVALDSAGAMIAGGVLRGAQTLMPPLTLPRSLNQSVVRWLLEHGYRLRNTLFPDWDSDEAEELRRNMKDFSSQFLDVRIYLPNKYLVTTNLLRRCSTVYLKETLSTGLITELSMNTLNLIYLSATSAVAVARSEMFAQLSMVVSKLTKLSCSCLSLSAALPLLASIGPQLKELHLNELTASTDTGLFTEVAIRCPSLEYFSIANLSHSDRELSTDALLLVFAERCRNLKRITIDNCHLSTMALRLLLGKCCGLTAIDRYGCKWSAEDTLTIAECGGRLDSISLCNGLLGHLNAYSALFAHLQRVQLEHDFLASPSAVAAVSCMTALDKVSIFCDSTIRPGAMNISGVLRALANSCRYLHWLTCTGQYTTDDSFAAAVATVVTSNAHFSFLNTKQGERNGTTVAPMPQVLADALALCRHLVWLEIECYSLTNRQTAPMVASLRWLVIFTLPKAADLTDAFLSALAQHCRDLAWLRVINSALLTEGALLQLIQRCPKLSYLDVHPRSMSAATAAALNAAKRLYKLTVRVQS
jgi:hypothetical protein